MPMVVRLAGRVSLMMEALSTKVPAGKTTALERQNKYGQAARALLIRPPGPRQRSTAASNAARSSAARRAPPPGTQWRLLQTERGCACRGSQPRASAAPSAASQACEARPLPSVAGCSLRDCCKRGYGARYSSRAPQSRLPHIREPSLRFSVSAAHVSRDRAVVYVCTVHVPSNPAPTADQCLSDCLDDED